MDNNVYHINENPTFPLSLYTNNYRYVIDGMTGNEYYPVCSGCLKGKCPATKKLQPLYVTDVSAISSYTVDLTISYSDGSSVTTTINKNTKYVIRYVDEGELKQCVGVIVAIGKVNNASSCTCDCCNGEDYLFKVDCSVEYNSAVLVIRSSAIRDIRVFTKYADEDTTIENAVIRGAALIGNVSETKITEATITRDGIVTAGKLVAGIPSEDNCAITGGCAVGNNPLGHKIVVIESDYTMGNIIGGNVVSAKLYEYTIEGGETDPETGTTTNCTLNDVKGVFICNDVTALGGMSSKGVVIDPTIKNSTVVDGTRSGNDMVSVKGIVISNICYGAAVEGGVLTGGTAVGFIGDKVYQIEHGITTGGFSNKATVTGGIVEGGTVIGNCIVGATVKGGIAQCKVSFNGTTVLGEDGIIKPSVFEFPKGLIDTINGQVDTTAYIKEVNNLIIWTKEENCFAFGSNISLITL